MNNLSIEYMHISELSPYTNNARDHGEEDIQAIIKSIQEFGFNDPIGVWGENNLIVEGHGRMLAAKAIGVTKIPVIRVDHLSDEQRRAYALAHNKTADLSKWDFELLESELQDISTIDMSMFGFDENVEEDAHFESNMKNAEDFCEDEDYQAFTEKFKPKKTTDDCYTPENVYDAIKKWCVQKYKIKNARIIRPFYPGGDYKKEKYASDCVVIDNPPFSILSEICRFYTEKKIPYFLFAPTLTLFSTAIGTANYVVCSAGITYENKAMVNTSFVTNMGDKKIIVSGELNEMIEDADRQNRTTAMLAKREYPENVITAAGLGKIAKAGGSFELRQQDVHFIRALDAQKEEKSGIYGTGFLISEKAALEKTALEKAALEKTALEKAALEKAARYQLSPREKEIIKQLGDVHN